MTLDTRGNQLYIIDYQSTQHVILIILSLYQNINCIDCSCMSFGPTTYKNIVFKFSGLGHHFISDKHRISFHVY